MACGDHLVLFAQALIQTPQSLSISGSQLVFKGFTEKSDAIIRAAIDSEKTSSLAEKGAGPAEIRDRRGFVCEQISQQVGQGHMMTTTTAAGAITDTTGIKTTRLAKQVIQFNLNRCNDSQALSEPGFLVVAESRQFAHYSAQQRRPVRVMIISCFVHSLKRQRHQTFNAGAIPI